MESGQLQRKVAIALGINTWTYILWESDRTAPSIGMWPRILSFLGYDPFPPAVTLGEQLVTARRRLGLSRMRLARRVEIDEGTLALWENGMSKPSGKHARIVEALLASTA